MGRSDGEIVGAVDAGRGGPTGTGVTGVGMFVVITGAGYSGAQVGVKPRSTR